MKFLMEFFIESTEPLFFREPDWSTTRTTSRGTPNSTVLVMGVPVAYASMLMEYVPSSVSVTVLSTNRLSEGAVDGSTAVAAVSPSDPFSVSTAKTDVGTTDTSMLSSRSTASNLRILIFLPPHSWCKQFIHYPIIFSLHKYTSPIQDSQPLKQNFPLSYTNLFRKKRQSFLLVLTV